MTITRALLFLAAVSPWSAPASIIYVFNSVTPTGTGTFDWNYTAKLSGDQKILNGTGFTDFAVAYDFLGATSASTSNAVAGITLSTLLENITSPQPFSQSVADLANQPNVRTNIAGSFTPNIGVTTNLYNIDIISTVGAAATSSIFQSAQLAKNAPGTGSDNTETGNTAQIIGPGVPTTAMPEPTTMTLMAGALIAVGLSRRRAGRR